MFGMFGNSQTKILAAALHELCYAARYANVTFGNRGAVGFFATHEMVVSHVKPTNAYDGDTFQLSAPFDGFRFLVYTDKDQIQVLGSGDYTGFVLTTSKENGSYVVFASQPLSRPIGRLTKQLVKALVHDHGALDTSNLGR